MPISIPIGAVVLIISIILVCFDRRSYKKTLHEKDIIPTDKSDSVSNSIEYTRTKSDKSSFIGKTV